MEVVIKERKKIRRPERPQKILPEKDGGHELLGIRRSMPFFSLCEGAEGQIAFPCSNRHCGKVRNWPNDGDVGNSYSC